MANTIPMTRKERAEAIYEALKSDGGSRVVELAMASLLVEISEELEKINSAFDEECKSMERKP